MSTWKSTLISYFYQNTDNYALFGRIQETSADPARVEGTARAGPGGGENRENVRQCGSNAGGDPPCACPCVPRAASVRFARLRRIRRADRRSGPMPEFARREPAEAEPSCSMPPRSGRSGLFLPYRVRPQLSAMAHSTHPPNF